jgi:hypothetical protein
MNSNQQKFFESLDKNLYYKVESGNYTHVQPHNMTIADVQYLMDQKTAGHNITEGAVNANTFLIG